MRRVTWCATRAEARCWASSRANTRECARWTPPKTGSASSARMEHNRPTIRGGYRVWRCITKSSVNSQRATVFSSQHRQESFRLRTEYQRASASRPRIRRHQPQRCVFRRGSSAAGLCGSEETARRSFPSPTESTQAGIRRADGATFSDAGRVLDRVRVVARRQGALHLTAILRLADEATESGWLSPELATGIRRVKGVKRLGRKIGNWLTGNQAQELLNAVAQNTLRRDGAMLGLRLDVDCDARKSWA